MMLLFSNEDFIIQIGGFFQKIIILKYEIPIQKIQLSDVFNLGQTFSLVYSSKLMAFKNSLWKSEN